MVDPESFGNDMDSSLERGISGTSLFLNFLWTADFGKIIFGMSESCSLIMKAIKSVCNFTATVKTFQDRRNDRFNLILFRFYHD